MYTALYRAYRPEVFDEILGQEHIVKILKNQLATDTVSHAYLFCGTRGTGKTTIARILAKGVNCTEAGEKPCGKCANCLAIKDGIFLDVIEIDAASNNGVENIRELRESVKYPPVTGRKKVYIIDEVHMLSMGAFNALLKTLEEPPENVMFILATTEPQKLPATILSRCMRLDFKRVAESILLKGFSEICAHKGISATEGALRLIAANADGSVRDGLSILDQCISAGQKEISRDDVIEFLGTAGEAVFLEMTYLVMSKNSGEALLLLDNVLNQGKDVRQFMKDWLSHYRALLISKYIKNPEDLLNMATENLNKIREQSDRLDLAEISDSILELARTISDAKWSTQPRILLELCIVKMSSDLMHAPMGAVARKSTEQKTETKTEICTDKKKVEEKTAKNTDKKSEAALQTEAEQNNGAAKNEDTEDTPATEANFNYDDLWHSVFEDAEASAGASFNLVRAGAELVSVDDRTFTLEYKNTIVKGYLEKNQRILEDLMEKHSGARRTMVCAAPKEGDSKRTTDDFANEIQSKLGISVEVE